VYAASKAGLHSLTLTWARELAGRGIRVNAVAPSAIRTEVFATNGFSDDDVNALFEKFKAINPLGRTGTVDDVTPWITKLADPGSSWVTGQIITIDGGVDLTSANDSLFLGWDDSSWGENSGSSGKNVEA
jgi:NAD(P)-dependent dehydrogenase (short-subunit alcohol dehydrogenase family)